MIKHSYRVRYGTLEDVREFYGGFNKTARIMVMEKDRQLLGVAGITIERGRTVAFSDMKEGIPPRIILWAARQFMALVAEVKAPVIALASDKYPNSGRFLKALGFNYIETQPAGDIYIWHNSHYQ